MSISNREGLIRSIETLIQNWDEMIIKSQVKYHFLGYSLLQNKGKFKITKDKFRELVQEITIFKISLISSELDSFSSGEIENFVEIKLWDLLQKYLNKHKPTKVHLK